MDNTERRGTPVLRWFWADLRSNYSSLVAPAPLHPKEYSRGRQTCARTTAKGQEGGFQASRSRGRDFRRDDMGREIKSANGGGRIGEGDDLAQKWPWPSRNIRYAKVRGALTKKIMMGWARGEVGESSN